MKIFIYISLFVFASVVCKGQTNLVPNGSFEDYSVCPYENMLVNTGINIVDGWFSIPDDFVGTPDYYNTCNNSITGTVGVPNNFWGSQLPYQGNAYTGFGIMGEGAPDDSIGYSEYIQCKLSEPLINCMKYKISFNVSLSEQSSYAFSKIGVVFTKDTLKSYGANLILHAPDVVSNSVFLSDTINWMRVSGTYIANGEEQFLTIGYFGSPALDTMYIKPGVSFWNYPYAGYYVDSVNLFALDGEGCINLPNVFTPNNDGINDIIDFQSLGLDESTAIIYNRWGEKIYETGENNKLWDGKNINKTDCSAGVYYYIVIPNKKEGQTITQKGFIQLIR